MQTQKKMGKSAFRKAISLHPMHDQKGEVRKELHEKRGNIV